MGLAILITLAMIQGITEFLPISSSGHLVLLSKIFPVDDQGLLIDIALHFGTLIAVLIYYWKDIKSIFMSIIDFKVDSLYKDGKGLLKPLIIATIPLVIGGAILYKFVSTDARIIEWIAINSIVFGVILWLADTQTKNTQSLDTLTSKKALFIGFAQLLAIFPGVSRSGITITAARFLGINREEAIKFSVLLSIPAIAGATILGLYKAGDITEKLSTDLALGSGFSFIASLLALIFFVRFARKFTFTAFAIYRILLGIILLGML